MMEQLIIAETNEHVPLSDRELLEAILVFENHLKDLADVRDYAERANQPIDGLVKSYALTYNEVTRLMQEVERRGFLDTATPSDVIERSEVWREY
jgi:hypothetical protein